MTKAQVVYCFDCFESSYSIGSNLLDARGMKATFFSQPDRMGSGLELSQYALNVLKGLGHEIGLYIDAINTTAGNVSWFDPVLNTTVTVPPGGIMNMAMFRYLYGFQAANERILAQYNKLCAKGFKPATAAASGRRWDPLCANLARDLFRGVRVASTAGIQTYPLPDPCNIAQGTFSSVALATTLQSVIDIHDAAEAVNGTVFIVVHDITASGTGPNDPQTIDTAKLAAMMDVSKARETAGTMKISTLQQALQAA